MSRLLLLTILEQFTRLGRVHSSAERRRQKGQSTSPATKKITKFFRQLKQSTLLVRPQITVRLPLVAVLRWASHFLQSLMLAQLSQPSQCSILPAVPTIRTQYHSLAIQFQRHLSFLPADSLGWACSPGEGTGKLGSVIEQKKTATSSFRPCAITIPSFHKSVTSPLKVLQ